MPHEERLTGIVLKKQTLGEADELVTLFTKEKGKVRVKVASAKRIDNRIRGSLLPASEVIVRVVGAGTIPKLIGSQSVILFKQVYDSGDKAAFFYWLSEVVIKATADEVEDPRLYALIKKALQALDTMVDDSEPIAILLCYTAIRLVEMIGFSLSVEQNYVRPVFSNSLGGFYEAGSVPDAIPVSMQTVRAFLVLEQTTAAALPMHLEALTELRNILMGYMSYQLERPINSTSFINT